MKVLHLGVFDRNIGDNIALAHIEYSIAKHFPNTQFARVSLEEFWARGNALEFTRKVYNDYVDDIDFILVGGGGLLEYGGYERMESNYKLPFYKDSLRFIKKPILYYGVGVNIFRGGIDYSKEAKDSLQEAINHSKAFSVRNDGSYKKLKEWIGLDTSKVDVVPDPGLLHLDRFGIERKNIVSTLGFQPAINNGAGINRNRFVNDINLKTLLDRFKDSKVFPHTRKDFKFGKPVITINEFENHYKLMDNLEEYLKLYKEIDYVIAMRGHGQMISIGMNIPGIYLSTQDKVRDFSIENGFEEYNIDITDEFWYEKLETSIRRLTEHKSTYLKEWYEIRDEFINKCHKIDDEWIEKNINEVCSL